MAYAWWRTIRSDHPAHASPGSNAAGDKGGHCHSGRPEACRSGAWRGTGCAQTGRPRSSQFPAPPYRGCAAMWQGPPARKGGGGAGRPCGRAGHSCPGRAWSGSPRPAGRRRERAGASWRPACGGRRGCGVCPARWPHPVSRCAAGCPVCIVLAKKNGKTRDE